MNMIYPVTSHTRHVGPGTTFVAIKGFNQDGVQHIEHALSLGARRIVCAEGAEIDEETLERIREVQAELVRVPDPRAALAQLSAQAHGYPARALKIIGITGTKGKSTCTYLLRHVLRTAGYRVACVSTIANWIGDRYYKAELTTEQPDYLHAFLADCVAEQIDYVVMEIAAQALTLHRVDGVPLVAALFTNFSQEHGEFYETMDAYFAAKKSIISLLSAGAPLVINSNDARVSSLAREYSPTIFFGASATASACPTKPWRSRVLVGAYNQQNVDAVCTLARALSISDDIIVRACETFSGVPGRLEGYVLGNGATVYIDYAHNPSSFVGVLSTLREITDELVVVFGAGGGRDAGKRPLMGAIAAQYASRIIITTDNPRHEDAALIAEQILAGVSPAGRSRVMVELDRAAAITYACRMSKPGAVIALLGKGPDEYQEIRGVKYPFSEREIVIAHEGRPLAARAG